MYCAGVKREEKWLSVVDNDPSEQSKLAEDASDEIGADLVEIPHRSADLSPTRNVFHIIKPRRQRIYHEDF